MYGPGRYEPDPTEGITNVKDLPAPQLVAYHRDHKQTACPRCSHLASRHKSGQRLLHDLGDFAPVTRLISWWPTHRTTVTDAKSTSILISVM